MEDKKQKAPLVCKIGCRYAVGESLCIVPLERMSEEHRYDVRYQKLALTEVMVIKSDLKIIDGILIPEYLVRTDGHRPLPFYEYELNYENRRVFNKEKVFNYNPVLQYVVGEIVKIRKPDKIFIKIQDEWKKWLNKEVIINEVIFHGYSSDPKYKVSMKYRNKYITEIIPDELIMHSINGRWQLKSSWAYDVLDSGFHERTIIYDDDLPF